MLRPGASALPTNVAPQNITLNGCLGIHSLTDMDMTDTRVRVPQSWP